MNPTIDRPTVICVDDDLAVLAALQRTLRSEPIQVLTTDRPERVLEWIDQYRVDLVISDHRMPEMAGTELLEHVWRRSPGTARIILTAFPAMATRSIDLVGAVDRIISKPWDGEALKRAIREILIDPVPED